MQLPPAQYSSVLLSSIADTVGCSSQVLHRFEQELGGTPGAVTAAMLFTVPLTDLAEAVRGSRAGPGLTPLERGTLIQVINVAAVGMGLSPLDLGLAIPLTTQSSCVGQKCKLSQVID